MVAYERLSQSEVRLYTERCKFLSEFSPFIFNQQKFFFFFINFFIFKNKKLHGLLYKTILKIKQLKDIRNYLQYDTNATRKNTNTTVQLQINLINN